MEQIIRVKEKYMLMTDRVVTVMLIRLINGTEVFATFEHEANAITNKELITKLRKLADYIESEHA